MWCEAVDGAVTDTRRRIAAFDTTVPNVARIYDFLLGGKDNISQVVPVTPDSTMPVPIQRRDGNYSKSGPVAVANLACTCL